MTIQPERVRALNDAPPREGGHYVLYWMQQSQRVPFNPALEWAVTAANERGLPVLVAFGLTDGRDGYPEANARHYAFLLQGLADVAAALEKRGIAFRLMRGAPDRVALDFAGRAALVVCDRGYLGVQKRWRERVAREAGCAVVQVEGDVVVPVETASGKHEIGARTLRPRLYRVWETYLAPLPARPIRKRADGLDLPGGLDATDPEGVLAGLTLDCAVGPVRRFRGGAVEAGRRLKTYLAGPFAAYGSGRGRPEAGAASHMSPYLHFGHVSPVAIALAVRASPAGGPEDRAAYLEELIVRRELAMNHVHYAPDYESYAGLPDWARRTLDARRDDPRPYLYDRAALEAGETHEPYWNAAMREMRETGYMHNHLRMYWGKKVLHWTATPEEAFDTLMRINNRYFLDGRDANSFTNVAWVFGLHDRPWGPHPVFGNVRYQSENSLRKIDADAYVRAVDALCAAEGAPGDAPRGAKAKAGGSGARAGKSKVSGSRGRRG